MTSQGSREASSVGWSLAEIKRTKGSYSARDRPAGDAGTVAVQPMRIRRSYREKGGWSPGE